MTYSQGKEILTRLQTGLAVNQAAVFIKKDEEHILNLISNDMVKRSAFVHLNKTRFGAQNLGEAAPVTDRGKVLFGLK